MNKKLLIIRLDAIGDYILFRNFIEILAKSKLYKEYKIDMICHKSWYELARELDKKYIDNFFSFDTEKYRLDNFYKINLEINLNLQKYDILINPTYSRTFLVDTLISKIESKIKIGNSGDLSNISLEDKNISDKYYTKLVKSEDKYLFEFDRNKDFFEKLLNKNIQINKTSIKYKNFIKPPFSNYIVFIIAANASKRKWSMQNYATLAKKFYNLGYEIVLCGGNNELKDMEKFKELFGNKFINLVGKTSLIDMISILNFAEFVIANDTGLAHMSITLKKQTFIISNGNHFGRFIPYPKHFDSYVKCFCPFDYKENKTYFYDKYYKGADLDINEIKVDKIFNSLELLKNNNKHRFNYKLFHMIDSNNEKTNFSKHFNQFYRQLKYLQDNILIYGNGTIGKTIQALIPDKIVGYVDINDENNHPKNLKNMKYDKIIISVLGREEVIIKYLVEELGINRNKIVTLELGNE